MTDIFIIVVAPSDQTVSVHNIKELITDQHNFNVTKIEGCKALGVSPNSVLFYEVAVSGAKKTAKG